jgi:hypothetical protein
MPGGKLVAADTCEISGRGLVRIAGSRMGVSRPPGVVARSIGLLPAQPGQRQAAGLDAVKLHVVRPGSPPPGSRREGETAALAGQAPFWRVVGQDRPRAPRWSGGSRSPPGIRTENDPTRTRFQPVVRVLTGETAQRCAITGEGHLLSSQAILSVMPWPQDRRALPKAG